MDFGWIKNIKDILGKHFVLSVFLMSITLFVLSNKQADFFSFELFKTTEGSAQAISLIIAILFGYYLFLSAINKVYYFIDNKIYEIKKEILSENKKHQEMGQFIEDLFNNQRATPNTGENDSSDVKLYLLILYKHNIQKFKALEIADIFQEEANERQKKETRGNVTCIPYVSKESCIKLQNLLHGYDFLHFDGEFYTVNEIVFEKLKNLESRGMI